MTSFSSDVLSKVHALDLFIQNLIYNHMSLFTAERVQVRDGEVCPKTRSSLAGKQVEALDCRPVSQFKHTFLIHTCSIYFCASQK